ncbi:MAG: hypothetical protein QMD50_00285 [Patescibacteria group bacterium]|nr:hypothetical protein [Patescibacteria group bacterium]
MFETISLWKIISVFFATILADVLWTLYIRRTNEGRAFSAAFFSAAIIVLGGMVVTSYVENAFYLIPATIGGFLGTWITIKYDLRKNKAVHA